VLTLAAREQLDLLLRLGAIGRDLGVTILDHASLSPNVIGTLVRKGLARKEVWPRSDCQPQRTAYWLTAAGVDIARARQAVGGPPLTRNQLSAILALERLETRGQGPASAQAWRAEVEAGDWRCMFQPEALERRGLVKRPEPGRFALTAEGRAAVAAAGRRAHAA